MKAMKTGAPEPRAKPEGLTAWQKREVYKEKQILAEEMAGLSPFAPGEVRGTLASVEHFSDGRSVAVVRDESSGRFAVLEVEQDQLERLELGQAVALERREKGGALVPTRGREPSRGRSRDGDGRER